MKQAIITGEREAGITIVPTPQPKEDWVLVKIHSAPMCTEYKAFASGRPVPYLGHEAAGEVVEVAQPGAVRVGDRVAVMPQYPCGLCDLCLAGEYIHCEHAVDFDSFTGSADGRATMAQYVLKPDWMLVPIPDDVSYDHGAMACCGLGPTFGAFQQMQVDAYDTVLVSGLGPVGLGGVINGSYCGARVIGAEPNPWRAEFARTLGAEVVVDPTNPDALEQIMDLTDGKGVDKTVDCSGVPTAHRFCMDATRRKGKVAFVGESGGADTPIKISTDMLRKGLWLIGAWHYNRSDASKLMQTIGRNGPKLDRFISHSYPMEQIQQAFETQLTGECAKVVLKPWEESA